MYRLNNQDFLQKISAGLKNPITKEEIFGDKIKISHLKRIDKIFSKGLHYYLDPKPPETSKEASVFLENRIFKQMNLI